MTEQSLPLGPAASQIAIKQLGTNGGGFFNVNSAHPYENPTPLSQFPRSAVDPADPGGALLHVRRDGRRPPPGLGAAGGDARRSSCRCCSPCTAAEQAGNPALTSLGADQIASAAAGRRQHGRQGSPLRHRQLGAVGDRDDGRVERLGQRDARLVHAARRPGADVADPARRGHLRRRRLAASTACSCSPIVAVFIAGLMVGRTPEYLGKKIEAYEMKMASLVVLIPCALVVVGTAIAVLAPAGIAGIANPGHPRLQRDPVRVLVGVATTTAARSPDCPRTRRSTTRCSASACSSRASGSRSGCSRSPARSRRRSTCRRRPARCRRTRRCSSCC